MVSYQGTAPGMGGVGRYFDSRERAEQWSRQVGVSGRVAIVDCDAAPDLLAALEALVIWDDGGIEAGELPGDLIDAARAAIAKARTGE